MEIKKIIDAIGKKCPHPVIMAKNALKDVQNGVIEVLVDNEISMKNVEKMCSEKKLAYSTVKNENIYKIYITQSNISENEKLQETSEGYIVVIDSDEMGRGDSELGKALMKGFIYTLTEVETIPKTIILYNKGVLLARDNSDSVEDLRTLQEQGVKIEICGACVNFYDIVKNITIGNITNMYNILNLQISAKRIIKP